MPGSRWSSDGGASARRTIAALLLVGLGAAIAWSVRLATPPAAEAPPREVEPAKQPTPDTKPQQEGNITQRVIESTVVVRCGAMLGAGFFVESDRILTNKHVTCGAEQFEVELADGRRGQAELQTDHSLVDLRTLRPRDLEGPPLPLGSVGDLAVGDRVLVVGNPLGLEFTVHDALVSALPRAVGGIPYVQLGVSVNPGNSGGPVVDQQGRVVGILTAKAVEAEGVALALPVNFAYEVDDGLRLTHPPADADADAFVGYRAQARISEMGHQLQLTEVLLRPRLLKATYSVGRGTVYVHLVRGGFERPGSSDLGIRITETGEPRCEVRVKVTGWRRLLTDQNTDLSRYPDTDPGIMKMAQLLAESHEPISLYTAEAQADIYYKCRLPGRYYYVALVDDDAAGAPLKMSVIP